MMNILLQRGFTRHRMRFRFVALSGDDLVGHKLGA
jgi:hypothetical protein